MKSVLNNRYHLRKQAEDLKATSERQPMSRAAFIMQARKLKLSISEQKQKTKA